MIPFCKTDLGEEEKKAISDCIDSGWVVMGEKTKEFEEKFAEYVGAKHAIFVDSGTSALFLACQYMKTQGITELTVPSLTFTATAETPLNAGIAIKFVDVNEETMCANALLSVHLMGNNSSYSSLIYDSAHRIEKDDIKYRSGIWCYSFYATKNITTVTGGMICTNDTAAEMWFRKARDHGLNLGTKERYTGAYKQYDVEFVGWRVKGDDLSAVIGLEQLKKLPRLIERRNELVKRYNSAFDTEHKGNHIYPVLVKNQADFVNYMYDNEIQTTVHFRPLHLMTAYKKYYHSESLPNTEFIGSHIVSLPLYPKLTNKEQDFIIKTVKESRMLI